jgi:hypothetical protein
MISPGAAVRRAGVTVAMAWSPALFFDCANFDRATSDLSVRRPIEIRATVLC